MARREEPYTLRFATAFGPRHPISSLRRHRRKLLQMSGLTLDVTARRLQVDPRNPAFYQNPYPLYARLHAEAPVVYWEQFGHWCFAGFADVNRLLRDRRFGREILHVATREELGLPEPSEHTRDFDAVDAHSMLEREPPAHTRLRSLVNRAFVSRQVERLRPAIAEMAHELIEAFPSDSPFDLLAAFAEPIPVRVIARMLGVPERIAPELLDWSHRMVAMYSYGRNRAIEEDANAAAASFSGFIRGYVAERRASPGDDLLSLLIEAEEDGARLSEDELISTAILLLNAGHEATVHAVGNGVKAILECREDPHCIDPVDRFRGNAVVENATEEILRFDPPLHMFTRFVLAETEESGIHLRKGEKIGLLLGATGRDPMVNSDPDRFDVCRENPRHTSFGAGIHFCVGAPLARLELQTALPILFQRCPDLRLAGKPSYRNAYHFHGLERLMVEC
ncbi:cytochrome P450 [soil metagenome]